MAYLHVTEARVDGVRDQETPEGEVNDFLRKIWNRGEGGEKRVFISAGGYTRETALQTAEEQGGLVAFGRLFISNPDLPARLRKDIPLAAGDRGTYYLSGNLTPHGYSDWPFADGSIGAI
ncbi:hypothetical protein HYDPIDRAFT_113527, partial [Hydnomerulius pinastri MD-312]